MNKLILAFSLIAFSQISFAEREFKYFELTKQYKKKLAKKKYSVRNQSPLIDRAWRLIKSLGINATNELTQDIIDFNFNSPLGQFNKPEMSWSSGVNAGFGIKLGRRVEPNLHLSSSQGGAKDWQVHDELSVDVSAYAYLSEQRTLGNVRISDESLALFTGVFFTRKYSYIHFADTYKNGLTKDFEKLLLSFDYFRDTEFLKINNGEVITKSDHMSAKIGFAAQTPSVYFISGYGRATIYTSKINALSYYKKKRTNSLQVTHVLSTPKGTSVQLGIQADFYGLLTTTLLGGEYNLDISQSSTTNFTFDRQAVSRIQTDQNLRLALIDLNKGKKPSDIKELANYVTSKEQGNRIQEEVKTFLLKWGKHKGSFTENVNFEKDGVKHYFYRYGAERVKLDKSWWDGIFRASRVNRFKAREIENMSFEYKANKDQGRFQETILEADAPISFRLSKQFHAKKNKYAYRERAARILSNLVEVDPQIIKAIRSQDLHTPLLIDMHAQVGKEGIHHMLLSNLSGLRPFFTRLCNKSSKCVKDFESKLSYIQYEYLKYDIVNIYNVKLFLQKLSGYADDFQDLKNIFGEKNIKINGLLKAKTRTKRNFQTFFSEGESQGYGVIKDFIQPREMN